jgi:hypothetical protein
MNTSNNFGSQLRAMNVISMAVMAGLLVFLMVAVYLRYSAVFSGADDRLDNIFKFAVPAVIFVAYILSKVLFKVTIEKIDAATDLRQKLAKYMMAHIISLMVLELPGIFAVVAYLLTGRLLYLGFAILMVFAIIFARPTRFRLINDLKLSREEEELLSN